MQEDARRSIIPLHAGEWLIILILYLFVLSYQGYRFGDEDMTETLSYAIYMNDHSLYPNDLYIQAVSRTLLNERYPFTSLLSLFSDHLDWACFFLHFLTSMLLISGLWTLGKLFLHTDLSRIFLVLGTLVFIYHLNLGGNEIWYNYFVPSHLAKAIAIWALLAWLTDKPIWAYGLVSLATFAQPVVGAQLALLFLIIDLQNLKLGNYKLFRGPIIYALTAGIWVISVFITNLVNDQTVSGSVFYQIMEARLAHHFFPSYYPLHSWILLLPLLVMGFIIWKQNNHKLKYFFFWSFAGMIIYVIGIELLEIPTLLSIQWFKVTVWLKPLALLAVLLILEEAWIHLQRNWIMLLLSSLVIISTIQFSGMMHLFGNKPYHFPGLSYYTAEMDLALKIKQNLPKDACILIPPDVTGIRYFSERSLYIDYKSNIHTKKYMSEAAQRREELYGLNLNRRAYSDDVMYEMKKHYGGLKTEDFERFLSRGADYVLVENEHKLDLKEVLRNSLFTLYQL